MFSQTWGGGGGGVIYSLRKISFFMVSSDLKYKLMRHVTFNPLLFWITPGLISCIFIEIQCIYFLFSVVHFFQGTSVFITYLFEHYQLWMMIVKPKWSSLQKHQNCVCSTLKSATIIILIYVCLYQLWVPKWQVLANRLSLAFAAHFK